MNKLETLINKLGYKISNSYKEDSINRYLLELATLIENYHNNFLKFINNEVIENEILLIGIEEVTLLGGVSFNRTNHLETTIDSGLREYIMSINKWDKNGCLYYPYMPNTRIVVSFKHIPYDFYIYENNKVYFYEHNYSKRNDFNLYLLKEQGDIYLQNPLMI